MASSLRHAILLTGRASEPDDWLGPVEVATQTAQAAVSVSWSSPDGLLQAHPHATRRLPTGDLQNRPASVRLVRHFQVVLISDLRKSTGEPGPSSYNSLAETTNQGTPRDTPTPPWLSDGPIPVMSARGATYVGWTLANLRAVGLHAAEVHDSGRGEEGLMPNSYATHSRKGLEGQLAFVLGLVG